MPFWNRLIREEVPSLFEESRFAALEEDGDSVRERRNGFDLGGDAARWKKRIFPAAAQECRASDSVKIISACRLQPTNLYF